MARQAKQAAAENTRTATTGSAMQSHQVTATPVEHMPPTLANMAALTKIWLREEGPWWVCSFVFHIVLVCSLALIGTREVVATVNETVIDAARVEQPDETLKEIGNLVIDPATDRVPPATERPPMDSLREMVREDEPIEDGSEFSGRGGGTALVSDQPDLGGLGQDLKWIGSGPVLKGGGGVGVGRGTGTQPGRGGPDIGFRYRLKRGRVLDGPTPPSQLAVRQALKWLARHQSPDGSWRLDAYTGRCKDSTCSGKGMRADIAGTALGLLPFLGAGQTHALKGPYRQTISNGIYYLTSRQLPDGSFSGATTMYEHGLAAIALCECFGMTGDQNVGKAAQAALNYIAEAQDPSGGGWRYNPKMPGDTSVTGWQVMALKSGQMAYLNVDPMVLENARKFLDSVSSGGQDGASSGGLFGYTDRGGATPTRSAVGLLCYQYLGVARTDAAMINGTAYLMKNLPATDPNGPVEIYYWYYATQVMHNQPGADWDTWNRKMRQRLVALQCKEGCAAGSWDPKGDVWGARGGRVMQTCLSALTLEVYYRYLPLYKLDAGREQ